MIQVAVMGYGTIGSGVGSVRDEQRDYKEKEPGQDTCKIHSGSAGISGDPQMDLIVHDFSTIEKDPDVGIVVEAMGGVNPAYAFAKACLLAGKQVVTSNKALVAAHGTELSRLPGIKILISSSKPAWEAGSRLSARWFSAWAGEQILEISGILNGTTNFILSKMTVRADV